MNNQQTTETLSVRAASPLKLFAINASLLTLLYLPALADLVADWYNDANYSHGFLAPLISAYLIWNKRAELKEAIQKNTERATEVRGAWLIGIALALYVVGNGAGCRRQRGLLCEHEGRTKPSHGFNQAPE